jgi:integrase
LHKAAGKAPGYWMSRTEAEQIAERMRTQWREEAKRKSAPDPRRTVGMLADRYARDHVRRPGRRPGPIAASENHLRIIRRLEIGGSRFEDFPLDSVTADDIEALREARRAELRETKKRHAEGKTNGRVVLPHARGGEIGIEHMMALLRHMFSWAAKKNLASATPFKRNGEVVVAVRAEGPRGRDRRLVGDEEARLLAAAQEHLREVIVALLETGCRIGELLMLRWSDVRPDAIVLRAENTKSLRTRAVPIMSRMRGVLDLRKKGPDGVDHASDRFVFGNEAGEQIKRVRHAWDNTCRRAKIEDLNIHDLRREFGSRLLESGAGIHDVSYWLGHTNVATTSQYLKTTVERLQRVARAFDESRPIARRLPNGSSAERSEAGA